MQCSVNPTVAYLILFVLVVAALNIGLVVLRIRSSKRKKDGTE